jgi:hypothetical protein
MTSHETMQQILDVEPLLNDFGYGAFEEDRKSAEQITAEIATNRARMLEPHSLTQFEAARAWLRQFPKIKQFRRHGSSNGLKHAAAYDLGYVTNGVLIAAALAEGFRAERVDSSPNARIAISARAWKRGTLVLPAANSSADRSTGRVRASLSGA